MVELVILVAVGCMCMLFMVQDIWTCAVLKKPTIVCSYRRHMMFITVDSFVGWNWVYRHRFCGSHQTEAQQCCMISVDMSHCNEEHDEEVGIHNAHLWGKIKIRELLINGVDYPCFWSILLKLSKCWERIKEGVCACLLWGKSFRYTNESHSSIVKCHIPGSLVVKSVSYLPLERKCHTSGHLPESIPGLSGRHSVNLLY